MAHLRELYNGDVLIEKLYAMFEKVKKRLEKNYNDYRILTTQSRIRAASVKKAESRLQSGNSARSQCDSGNGSKTLSHRLKNLLESKDKACKQNTSFKGELKSCKPFYYTNHQKLFYSKRRMKIVRESENEGRPFACDILKESKETLHQSLDKSNHAIRQSNRKDKPRFDVLLNKIKSKCSHLNQQKLNCFFIKNIHMKAIKKPLVTSLF